MAIDPPGFYGFRSQNSRQYPVWMNSGVPAPRTNRVQAKPEYENVPPAAEPPPKPPATPPLMGDMAPAYAQAEGFGGNFGAPAGPNQTWGGYLAALGLASPPGPTAPLGVVSSEPLGAPMGGSDIGPGAGPGGFGGGLGSMGAAAMGLGVGGLGAMSGADIMGFGGAQEGGAGGGGAAGGAGSGGGADSAGGGMGGIGGMDGAGGGMFRGGIVTANRLRGPDPRGPDDGYVAMDKGEGVLTAEAVRHYGPGLVHRLNRLAVPKKAMRG